ncbi:MAG: hypothetical protein ACLSUW_10525 [Akkermansia sp.]
MPLNELRGDLIVVKTGQRVPMDGVITRAGRSGRVRPDGESLPVDRVPEQGDQRTFNRAGYLKSAPNGWAGILRWPA